MDLVLGVMAVGFLAMIVVAYLAWTICREDTGTPQMAEIAGYIQEGANAFIKRQYRTIAFFLVVTAIPLAIAFRDVRVIITFAFGTSLSLLAGYIGLRIATQANVRTASAARTSSAKAFALAFRGGAVVGLSVMGLSLLGASFFFWLYRDPRLLIGFGFGASLAALFAQLGGGIFTKAADIGADLVGKIEHRIPEDDPRNPAVIADQVGDNVGDCAGRGSDLFESMSDDYATTMILGTILLGQLGMNASFFSLALGASGVLATMAGVFSATWVRNVKPAVSLNIGFLVTAVFCTLGAFLCSTWLLNGTTAFYAVVAGLVASLAVGVSVQYYIGPQSRTIRRIAQSSERGAAINILTGISYAFQTPFLPLLFVLGAILFSFYVSGGSLYGLVAANLGTDLMIGIIMSGDSFGPISDNAAGISQMSGTKTLNGNLEELDATGNITKAYAKAFAAASGTFSTVLIFATYGELVGLQSVGISLMSPIIIAGLLLGAVLPFLFSSMAIGATAQAALQMVDEVRRQFQDNPMILEGKAKPDYARCVDIGTKNALRQMIRPALLALLSPIAIGLLLGKYALGAMLLGALSTSVLLSTFFTFAGGMWDNAKKYIERTFWMKGTPTHAAAVIGDTVGDPLKDVAGPSLNIFMKLINMTALLIVPLLL